MDALIVGAGDVGRWFANLWDGPVTFADIDRSAVTAAAEGHPGARTTSIDGTEVADVVVVAVPIRVATEVIEAQAGRAREAIVDLTGSMVDPLEAMNEVAPDLERVSYHPLFAPEHAPGNVAKSLGSAGSTVDRIDRTFRAGGNRIVAVEASVHDDAMATVQGRAHAAVLAFGLAAEPVPPGLETPVFEDLEALRERVTGGEAGVYADIQATFDGAETLRDALDRLQSADRETFEELYKDAG